MNAYISVVAALAAFGITAVLGRYIIPWLKKLKFGQTILEEGPNWHKAKEGTPTMGGLFMMIGFSAAVLIAYVIAGLFVKRLFNTMCNAYTFAGIGLALGMGIIGFLDDYIKVVKKRNLGLTAMQKTVMQMLVSLIYLAVLLIGGMKTLWLPFVGTINLLKGFGVIAWPIMLLFVYGFVNAVNLTDGIDGLAASVTMIVGCFFMIMAGIAYAAGINVFAGAVAGACCGFLVWNIHPAKVFMGDTGSMFLGGAVVGLAFGIGYPVLLIPAGIVYLLEALSVMIQVTYYKKTKKRLFKMSPIHHHFEMSGWKEEKIVLVFGAVTVIGCIVAALPIILR